MSAKLKFVSSIARQASLVMLAALFLSAAINAQTTVFSFEATLPNSATPATDTFEMEFKLFDASAGGMQIGATNLVSEVEVENRAFTVNLDFGAAAFPGADRFIEISYRRAGSNQPFAVGAPRRQVLSVPYAIRALNAATADNALSLNGIDPDDLVQTSDSRLSDSRDPNPGSNNYIQNTTAQQTPANFNISGSGKASVFDAATQYNLGGSRVLSTPAGGNLFVGTSAGQANTTGAVNTFIGQFAGYSNTTGTFNSFLGNSSGASNTTGCCNNFFGNSAGQNNTTGNLNSFFGGSAGLNNTTGSSNAFFGDRTGQNNTTGFSNSFYGISAGQSNVTGNNLTLVGTNANVGASNLSFATAIGAGAIVGANNTLVLGRNADTVQIPGALNVTGALNTATLNATTMSANTINAATQYNIGGARVLSRPGTENLIAGVLAGNGNTSGAGNSFFGFWAGGLNTTGGDNAFFGRRAGTHSTGSGNSFFGAFAGNRVGGAASGNNNTFVGYNADFDVTQSEGYNNTLVGANAKIDVITNGTVLRYATAIGANARVAFNDMVVIGKEAGVYDGISRPADIVRTAGIFQPALASPGGSPVCFNNGISLCSSSLRYKTDVQPFFGGLNVVKRLTPIAFRWRDNGRPEVGFAAEEVFKIEPLLTFRNQAGEIEGVHYAQVSTVLVNSVKEQQTQIEQLQEQNKQLRQEIEALKKLFVKPVRQLMASKKNK